MADKPVTTDVAGGAQYSASTLNANFAILEEAIEDCLGRGGTGESPNSMTGNLDMDTNRITNLGDPVADADAISKGWFEDTYGTGAVSYAEEWAVNPEDTLVSTDAGGDGTTDYSALHWAAKSSDYSDASAASAASALSSLTSFEDVYHGASSTEPTENVDVGDLYYDTVDNVMKVCVGTDPLDWDATPSAIEGTVEVVEETGTDTSTVITTDYDLGSIQVFIGPAFISPASTSGVYYTATDGSTITVYGTTAGDDIIVVKYGSFYIANHYTKAEIDVIVADIESDADLTDYYNKTETGAAITSEITDHVAEADPHTQYVEDGDTLNKLFFSNEIRFVGGDDSSGNSLIQKNQTVLRDELQLYASGDAYGSGSLGAGFHLYGNNDDQHAGNITMMTGQSDSGDARLIISGGSANTSSDGYRTNTDTRVTIGNGIFNFVDDSEDDALLTLYNPIDRPAICFRSVTDAEGELAVPTGEAFAIGHWDGSTFTARVGMDSGGDWIPKTDGAVNLGDSNNRWDTVYATSSTISTSDAREKTFLEIEQAEYTAARKIKAALRKFKFNTAITEKGDDARIHFGVSAQEVKAILEVCGLDPFSYAFLCYDEWEAEYNEDGSVKTEAGNRYGIRYEELLTFIMLVS